MRSSKSKIIVGVIAFFLVLSVGYALFSRSLNLSGTAKAEGSFDIIFDRVEKITEEGSKGATATIEETKKHNLEVVVPELQYPGAYASVDTVIKNVGSVDAVLKGIIVKDVNGNEINVDELSSDDIEVTFTGVAKNEVMKPNDEKKITLMFKWKRESVNPSSSVTFEITMQYEQAVGGEDTTTPSSDDFTFPTITGSLGDNVKYTYANGDLSIEGTGNMNSKENSIAEEVGTSLSNTLANGNEKMISLFSSALPSMLSGNASASDFGTKDELYSSLTLPESEDGMGFTDEEANYIIKILYSNPRIKSVSIKDGVTSIRSNLFKNLNANINITIPSSVTSLGTRVFWSSKLNSVTISSGLSVISSETFANAEISNIKFNGIITEVGDEVFSSTKTNSVVLKDGIQKIGTKAFSNSNINTVSIGSGLNTISESAFNSAKIQTLNLPNGITTLGNYAFSGFKANNLKLPSSITTIGENALANIKIDTLTFNNVDSIGKNAFSNSTIGTLKFINGPTTIASFAFHNTKVDSLTLSNNTEVIDRNAFQGLSIDTLVLPDSVSQLNDYSFGEATINTLKLGSGVKILTSGAFTNSTINSLDLGSGITTIKYGALSYINGLKKLTIPSNVTIIEEYSMNGCEQLLNIVNKTGKAFDWNSILGGASATSFETGTAEVNGRTITITK